MAKARQKKPLTDDQIMLRDELRMTQGDVGRLKKKYDKELIKSCVALANMHMAKALLVSHELIILRIKTEISQNPVAPIIKFWTKQAVSAELDCAVQLKAGNYCKVEKQLHCVEDRLRHAKLLLGQDVKVSNGIATFQSNDSSRQWYAISVDNPNITARGETRRGDSMGSLRGVRAEVTRRLRLVEDS